MHFGGFWTFAARAFYVLDFLPFAQGSCIALHVICMDEEIFPTVVWCDEAEAFL